MAKISRNVTKEQRVGNNCTFLRFLVIVLSFLCLISRVIYCTYATWLTFTTFDCIPCINSSVINSSSHLFVSHHSSVSFKSVRDLDIKAKDDSDIKNRSKRSNNFTELRESTQSLENYSQFLTNITDFYDFKLRAQKLAKEAFKQLDIELNANQNKTESKAVVIENKRKTIQEVINRLFANNSLKDGLYENGLKSESQPMVSDYSTEEALNQSDYEDNGSDTLVIPIIPSSDDNISNETAFERFTYIPSNDLLNIRDLMNTTNETIETENMTSLTNGSNEWSEWMNNSSQESDDMDGITMTILLNEREVNSSDAQQKSLNGDQLVNDSSYLSSLNDIMKTQMNDCSHDCTQFLSIELSDPSVRKWATIVITGVLYLYAFVMFCIFIGSVLAIVDLLVISTFIEGAKLFAGFILIIIDSFNGKEVHFNLIDIKFNVQSGANGWTADFSYSEYLLDIIVFFLSTFLCIRVFKCFEKRPKKVPSVEELAETRGTYRSNHSRNSLEPIYEHN